MDLKITVYRTTKHFVDNKECFREMVKVVDDNFGYSNFIRTFKDVFGSNSVINFCVI